MNWAADALAVIAIVLSLGTVILSERTLRRLRADLRERDETIRLLTDQGDQ